MAPEERDVRPVAERGTPSQLVSAETLHWDGTGSVTRCWRPPEDAVPVSPALRCPLPAPVGTGGPGRGAPTPTSEWAGQAAPMTLYLAPMLLANVAHAVVTGVTGTLVWLGRKEKEVSRTAARHPALLVQAASAPLQRGYVELMLHLPADDPLRHHMDLVLRVTYAAEGGASLLYAEALTDALAVHFLRRYAACEDTRHEVSGGLSPAKLQRVLAYIQAHLGQELSLTTLATVVQLSPDHFARLFKQTTGQSPHQYVLWCRIERAKQLLAETDMPLSMIGFEVGCTDHSAFTALFRKHVAMTPKAYRVASQGM